MFRRSGSSPSVLLGILIVTAICLLTKNYLSHREDLAPQEVDDEGTSENNRTITAAASLLNSPINGKAITERHSAGIEPFPEFRYEQSDVLRGLRLAEKRDWWSWNGDSNCLRHQVYLLKAGSQPKPGAFVSFPGSGNTWLRTILMGITGLFIGSVYDSTFHSDANNRSYKLPTDCNCWLLQKTHDFSLYENPGRLPLANPRTLEKFEGKGILLIRNPFKAIQSYLNFEHGGMTGLAPKSAFLGKEWGDFVRHSVYSWELLATVWIGGLKHGGVVYYENLYYNTSFELKRILKMIGFNDYDKERFDCGLRHAKDKTFKRKTSVSESPYTEKQKLLIQKAIENVQVALKKRKLDPLPVHYYMTARRSDNLLPVCKGNLLDQRKYHYKEEGHGSFDSSQLISTNGPCRLLTYTVERAVTCFDAIRKNRSEKQLLHLVFIGDSRIRQQFFNFLRLIPDHDRKSRPSPIPPIHHGDIDVISDVLMLKLSFQWRPLLDDNVTETIRQWASPNHETERPYLIFLSMVLWHLVRIHSQDEYNVYQGKLKVINPILNQLSKGSQIIWLHQYPMLTFYGGMPYGGVHDSDIILSEKAHRYNKDVRHILRNNSSIRIWDSSNPLAEEYVRGCALIRRGHPGPRFYKDPDHSFIDCNDYIHTGYSALSLATQILFNDICNAQMEIDL
ncbi:hypothetical protein GHT06_016021 [Daphnia sinensis]|uniref:Uncharacterized protein n=1 Tax=Daphnia sinensis TaxID=1820382 RepID=A0AAD5PTX8_9CRUS|nr:hypothetical protein GHT06_016021 [Daphnia sinensis]